MVHETNRSAVCIWDADKCQYYQKWTRKMKDTCSEESIKWKLLIIVSKSKTSMPCRCYLQILEVVPVFPPLEVQFECRLVSNQESSIGLYQKFTGANDIGHLCCTINWYYSLPHEELSHWQPERHNLLYLFETVVEGFSGTAFCIPQVWGLEWWHTQWSLVNLCFIHLV